MTDIRLMHNGIEYTAEYEVVGDTLLVHLADGSTRETELRGLNPFSAAMAHLRSFVLSQPK